MVSAFGKPLHLDWRLPVEHPGLSTQSSRGPGAARVPSGPPGPSVRVLRLRNCQRPACRACNAMHHDAVRSWGLWSAGWGATHRSSDIHPRNGAVTRGLGPTRRSARLERPTALSRHGASESKPRLVYSSPWRDGWPTAPGPVKTARPTRSRGDARYWRSGAYSTQAQQTTPVIGSGTPVPRPPLRCSWRSTHQRASRTHPTARSD
jgi:hypothetical protein